MLLTLLSPQGTGFTLSADGGVYSYSGNNADLIYTPIGGFTLVADGATYTYSGNDANLLFNRLLSADGGTYTYAGNNANTLFNRLVGADGGIYSYAGNNANTLFNRRVGSDGGTFAYSGNDANLLFGYSLLADGGSYTYSGNNADLTYTPAGSCPSVAQIWAYQILPGVTASQMLLETWQARDPWATPLPSTYSSGTAGNIVGNRLDVAVSTLATNAQVTLALKILRNKTVTNPSTGVMTVFDDDGVTPLFTANIFQDAGGTTPYDGNGINLRNRLT